MTQQNRIKIDRHKFKIACCEYKNMKFIDMRLKEIEDCARDFGMEIKFYLRNDLDCEVKNREKVFLFKIKYGF